jgi:hypothetical protein
MKYDLAVVKTGRPVELIGNAITNAERAGVVDVRKQPNLSNQGPEQRLVA